MWHLREESALTDLKVFANTSAACPAARRPSRRWLIGGGAVLFAAFTTVLLWFVIRESVVIEARRYYVLGDDAMISMRYAYNLAHSRGLLWNPGEYVEGITNLGWTLVMAAVHWFGAPLSMAPLVVKILNVLLHVSLAGLLLWRLRPIPGVVAAVLVALDGSLVVWGMSGFEVTLEALLIVLACLPFLDGRPATMAPIWAALAFVVRPDAAVVFACVALLVLFRRQRRSAAALVAGVLIVAGVFAFQRLYYGDWLPNTFHLKAVNRVIAVTRGVDYLERFALGEFFSLPLLACPLVLVFWRRDLALLCALPLVWTLYVVSVGGDAFPYGRFFAPIIPLTAALAGLLIDELVRIRRVASLAMLALLGAGLGVHVSRALDLGQLASITLGGAMGRVCLALVGNANLPPDSLVGVYYAGTTPYLMPEHRFHDFLGKSDRVIANSVAHHGPPGHNKWDYDYSLGQVRPDVIIPAAEFDSGDDGVYRARLTQDYAFHPELWLHPLFRSEYRKLDVSCKEPTLRQSVYVRQGHN